MRVGVFGGAFNPPHVGHLVCAQEAHASLELELVVFVPMALAPHREIEDDPGAGARVSMCERAVAGDERFRVSRVELDRGGKSYTVDTLRTFHERAPGDELVLVLGADQARALPDWREPAEVARLCAVIAVADRGGAARSEVAAQVGSVSGAAQRLAFFDMPRIDVSSTLVRRRASAGLPVRYIVPDGVAAYVSERGLYGAPLPAAVGDAR